MKRDFFSLVSLALVVFTMCVTVNASETGVVSVSQAIGADAQAEIPVQVTRESIENKTVAAENVLESDEGNDSRIEFSGSIYASWIDGFYRSYNEYHAWNVNQTWLTASRELDTETNGFDWGFRADAVFGTEHCQSVDDGFDGGWGTSGDGYGMSFDQLYAEVGFENFSAKVGKFETLLGYESSNGVNRLFNTFSYMCTYEPFAHYGVLGEWEISDRFSLNCGATMGADKSFEAKNNYGFLFGGNWQITERLYFSYEGMLNRLVDEDYSKASEYMHTFTLSWDVTERFNYTFVTNYGSVYDLNEEVTASDLFGIGNYFEYELTEKVTLGLRYEWFQTKEMPGGAEEVKGTYQEIALGTKYDINKHLMIRPELRYDWIDEDGKSDGFTGGIGGAVKF